MGKNSKARRDAKAKQRARRQRASTSAGAGSASGGQTPFGDFGANPFSAPPPTDEDRANRAWDRLMRGLNVGVDPAALRTLSDLPARAIDRTVEPLLTSVVGNLWEAGWQPSEVVRQSHRAGVKPAVTLFETVIHVDHAQRSGQRVDPRWAAQVADVGHRSASTSAGWYRRWREGRGLDGPAAVEVTARLLATVAMLPRVEMLIPPPGQPDAATFGAGRRSTSGDPILERVRKLLAKAEATEFEAEQAAFTAKAQELMTRHAIDIDAVETEAESNVPRISRLPVDAPYADAKSLLLNVVANANRCRAVGMGSKYALVSIFGHPDDLVSVELLFTSLLVQAQKALAVVGRGPAGSRARSASFRSSFFVAFATRIGERLEQANDDVVAAAGPGALPVLRRREDAARELIDELYGDNLVTSGVRGGFDPYGHQQGEAAADLATLGRGAIDD